MRVGKLMLIFLREARFRVTSGFYERYRCRSLMGPLKCNGPHAVEWVLSGDKHTVIFSPAIQCCKSFIDDDVEAAG